MKTSTKIILGLSAVAATGTLIALTRSVNSHKRLINISNEGYETAHDILYPKNYNKGRKLHYGPVLPVNDENED